jgi:hypothetical protein
MRLGHEHFYTLNSSNLRIRELLQDLNHRQQRVHPGSRQELYVRFVHMSTSTVNKPALGLIIMCSRPRLDIRCKFCPIHLFFLTISLNNNPALHAKVIRVI